MISEALSKPVFGVRMRGPRNGSPKLVVGRVEGDEVLGRVDRFAGHGVGLTRDGEGEHSVVDSRRRGFRGEGDPDWGGVR